MRKKADEGVSDGGGEDEICEGEDESDGEVILSGDESKTGTVKMRARKRTSARSAASTSFRMSDESSSILTMPG